MGAFPDITRRLNILRPPLQINIYLIIDNTTASIKRRAKNGNKSPRKCKFFMAEKGKMNIAHIACDNSWCYTVDKQFLRERG